MEYIKFINGEKCGYIIVRSFQLLSDLFIKKNMNTYKTVVCYNYASKVIGQSTQKFHSKQVRLMDVMSTLSKVNGKFQPSDCMLDPSPPLLQLIVNGTILSYVCQYTSKHPSLPSS